MEGNKDESNNCIKIAEKYIKTGDFEKANKFLNKAERLFPSDHAKKLLQHIEQLSSGGADRADTNADETTSPGRRSAPGTPHSERRNSHSHNDCHEIQPKYTREQLEAVQKIRKCKDYYEILGLPKDCSEDDLKKSYKKLALKFHPDKNHAPGATEAFKAISNAFSVLSDMTKRKRYDEFGAEEQQSSARSRRSHAGYEYDYSRGFEGDISADDLFRMFFGGGVFTQNHPTRQRPTPHYHQQQQRQNDNPYMILIQLSPLIIILVLSLLSSLFVSPSPYSLRRDAKYRYERRTPGLGVSYFVPEDFKADTATLNSLERQVEEDYIVELQHACYRERQNRETAIWRAQMYGNQEMYRQARSQRTLSCDRLREINIAA